jgi:type IX secretion system PorP/SprF family membrane protein
MIRKYLVGIVLLIIAENATAQDPHFSQFFVSPLSLNPALTGNFDGSLRVAGNYRNQWMNINKAFETSTASVDFGIMKNKLREGDRMGLGFFGMTDKSGEGILKRSFFAASGAYHKSLDEDGYHHLGVGFQLAFSQMRVDFSRARFSDMLSANGFTNTSGDPVAAGSTPNINYLDMGAGLLYQGTTNGVNSFYIGSSMYHLNQPKESFLNQGYKLNRRFSFHGSGSFPINDNVAFHTNVLYQKQAGSNELVAGLAIGYTLLGATTSTTVYTGLWSRFNSNVNDALVPYLGLEYNAFRLGISYDVNVSALKTASESRGGLEVSLIYIKNTNKNGSSPFYMRCPKF